MSSKFFTKKGPISIILSVVLSVFFIIGIVEAATTISSNISTGGTLSVTGASTLTGNVTASGTLGVTGASTLTGAVTTTAGITSGANISSDTDSTDSLGVTGTRWASIFSDGFTGNTIALDGLTGVNSLTITDAVADALSIIHGATDFMVFDTSTPALTITPNTSIGGTLSVTGASTLTGNVTASGTLGVTGVLTATAGIVSSNNITVPATYGLDTAGAGALNIGVTTATSVNYGSSSVTAHTFTSDGTGTAEVVLPAGSIDSTELLDGTVAKADMSTAFMTIGNLADGTSGWIPDALVTSFTIIADAAVVGANSVISVSVGANATTTVCAVSTRTATINFVVVCSVAPDNLATLQYMIVN